LEKSTGAPKKQIAPGWRILECILTEY
jgi:hypothetical protein